MGERPLLAQQLGRRTEGDRPLGSRPSEENILASIVFLERCTILLRFGDLAGGTFPGGGQAAEAEGYGSAARLH